IPYITAGDPDGPTTVQLALEFEKRGADLVELGVPFSDPLADGTTIQRASQRALEGGTTLRAVLGWAAEIRQASQIPLVLMSYVNPLLRMGAEAFAAAARQAGVDGLIVPDLPPEEAREFLAVNDGAGVATVFLAAPTSPPERLRIIAEASRGYIYYVSLKGVTGARAGLPLGVRDAVQALRALTAKPVVVGFGIGTPVQAAEVATVADGVIVGSAIVDQVERLRGRVDLVEQVGGFVEGLVRAVRHIPPGA
ncbi:MAG TPA: tryptophan synthase subunit alpha, partial [Candidatus Methylomirabilis sp.]|nr:tryptophan synthase subunit alpha [Candidatus Methylomirabilis sp.]